MQQSHRVMFVVEYEDGRTAEFSIDRLTLSLGDYVARIIARERQEKGDLPSGEIRAVRRSDAWSNDATNLVAEADEVIE